MNYFEKVGAHHVDCDGDDGGDVSDGGDVEDSHDLPCKLSIHWNVTNACTRTALNTICLVIVADFCFYYKYFIFDFSYFSVISFGFMGIPLTLNNVPLYECCAECQTTQKIGFVSNFICILQIFL